ncbi:MAG: RNA 2',3'-cyclic phosphodiesterase [Arachnia sp.]
MAARMFTAVLPPRDVVDALDQLVEPRREADPALRWTRPDGWHVTTSFMERVDGARVEALEENLAAAAARTAPFHLTLAGGVAFPHPAKAKVLGLAVASGHDPLSHLSSAARTAATTAGIEVDGARFVGHLTLARAYRGVSATRWLEILSSFPAWEWRVDELGLVESHQTGRRYEVIGRFGLGTETALD